jgi:DnaK suppressor protein
MTSTTASAVPYIDDDFLLGQRSELTARKRSYREQVDRLSAAVEELADADDAPDLGDDEGFAEANPASVERDRVLSLAALARRRIEDVDAALRRLDAGAYGACRSCRRAIPLARLEAVPEATQCVSCASGSVLRRR